MIMFRKFLTALILFTYTAYSGKGQQFRLQGTAAQTAAGIYRITADATGQEADNDVFVYQASYLIRGIRKTVRGMAKLIH